jgi:ribonucleoside-diphosphate reductase beta chain
MLTWDEEVKPTSPVPSSGSIANREAIHSPQIPQPALRTLDDAALAPAAPSRTAAAQPAAPPRRVKAAD